MQCTRKVQDDLVWVGCDDRRLACFEGVYGVPNGVSYNSYLLLDEKTVLMDTVDKAVFQTFFENVRYALNGRELDYLVIHHMEPDHAYTIETLLLQYPKVKILCNTKSAGMLKQYFPHSDFSENTVIINEGDTMNFGKHRLTFINAPMVHWPEVMMSYDLTSKTLFSADAFGTFGALNGSLFADEVDFFGEYMDEARRYYTNIVGKYGPQVQAVLKKAAGLQIDMVCPLHGPVWRTRFDEFLDKYQKWSTYTPEEQSVCIAYTSVYGHTENAANILACRLVERGVKVRMFDCSVIDSSYVLANVFRCSHLVIATTTYNMGIFIKMEEFLHDLANHNIQNRKVAVIENGSWAPAAGKQVREILGKLKNVEFVSDDIKLLSALSIGQEEELDELAKLLAQEICPAAETADPAPAAD